MEKQAFDEQLAEKLQEKYGLANSTLRVWKYRNTIPAKYLQEDYVQPEAASKKQALEVARLLHLPYTNRAGIEGISAFRLRDFLKDKKHAKLQKTEAKSILKQFQQLQRQAQKIAQTKNLDLLLAFIKLPMLKPLTWLDDYKLYNRLRQGSKQLSDADWAKLEQSLLGLIHDIEGKEETNS